MSHPDDITPEMILRLRSPYGGWTKAALFRLGVSWPPRKGWRRELETLWRKGKPRRITRSPDLYPQTQPDLFSKDGNRAA